MIEMQAIAATLIENFEFALPPQIKENIVRRKPTGIMAPMADGHPGVDVDETTIHSELYDAPLEAAKPRDYVRRSARAYN